MRKNRLRWVIFGCMAIAFWLSWFCIGSEYTRIAKISFTVCSLYLVAFAGINQDYLIKLVLGKKKKNLGKGSIS